MNQQRWTPEDIETLRAMWAHRVHGADIARQLHRTRASIFCAARRYCGERLPVYAEADGRRAWTLTEENHLRKWWREGMATREIARQLDRSPRMIYQKADQLGLGPKRKQRWTPEEDALCLTSLPTYRVAQKLGRTASSVESRRQRLRHHHGEGS